MRLLVPLLWAASLLVALPATPARADRTTVFSIREVDCGSCGDEIMAALKRVPGVKKTAFDIHKVELTATLADGTPDSAVVKVVSAMGHVAIPGRGQGAYLPPATWPEGLDVATLTGDGSAVGPLESLRVAGKYTVLDVYADWCGPCRVVDEHLRDLATARTDLAVRKLNVVNFKTPLAKSLGTRLKALPYVVVFAPDGRRTDITGLALDKLDAALGAK